MFVFSEAEVKTSFANQSYKPDQELEKKLG